MVEPTENATTLEDVLAYFDREPVDLEKTNAFSQIHKSELITQLESRLRDAFRDIEVHREVPLTTQMQSAKQAAEPEDQVPQADIIINLPDSTKRVVVEINQFSESTSIQPQIWQLERNLNLLSTPEEPNPLGVLLLTAPLAGRDEADEFERVVGACLDNTAHKIRILTPQQCWPVFFEDYREAEQDRLPSEGLDAARIYMLSDDPLQGRAGDELGFGAYAAAFGGLINDEQTSTPLTLAINAKWGVGKTSLARMIEEHLVESRRELGERPHLVYWFNAWMHDEAKDLAQAFMTDIVRFANRQCPRWRRWLRPLPSELCSEDDYKRRRKWFGAMLVLAAVTFSYALVEIVGIDIFKLLGVTEAPSAAKHLESTIGSIVVISALSFALLQYLGGTIASVSTFLSMGSRPADTGSIESVRRRLMHLIRSATPSDRKFVVFIDDLERCRPTRSIDVLEIVNQLLSFEQVVTIIIADMAALAANAEIKYAELAKRYNPESGEIGPNAETSRNAYGRLFLQKFVQLQFDLPPPSKPRIDRLLAKLSNSPTNGEDAEPRAEFDRVANQIRQLFGDVGAIIVGLGPTLFSPWHPPATTGTIFRRYMRDAHWSLRPFAMALWIPLLPYHWAEYAGLRATGEIRLRQRAGTQARYGKSFIVVCLVATGSFLLLLATQARQGLLGLPILTVDDVYWVFSLMGLWAEGSIDPSNFERVQIVASEMVRLVDLFAQTAFIYSPALAAGVVVFVLGLTQRLQLARESRKRAEEFAKDFQSTGVLTAPQRPNDSALGEHAWQALYLRKRQQFLSHDSALFMTARGYAFQYVLPVPRNAKRLLNRLRLNLFILDQQGAFADPSEFGPTHLGKWVALHERWPELAVAIARDSSLIERIESQTPKTAATISGNTRKKLTTLLQELDIVQAKEHALHDLLAAQPRLAPVIRRLTMFEVEQIPVDSSTATH